MVKSILVKLQKHVKTAEGRISYFVYVPTRIVKFKGWELGDEFEFIETDGHIEFKLISKNTKNDKKKTNSGIVKDPE